MHEERGAGSDAVVLVVADAGPEVGVGHAIRCQALAEELLGRGLRVSQVGRMDVPWVADAYQRAGIELLGPSSIPAAAAEPAVRAVVLDSYTLPREVGEGLRSLGKPVLAIVDDTTRGVPADLYLEQNPASSPESLGVPPDHAMCGPAFALIRDLVRRRRSRPWQPHDVAGRIPHVAVLFGGTDPAHGALAVAHALGRTETALSITLVAATAHHARELEGVSWAPDQHPVIVPAHPGVVADLARADLVISAGGSTVYELMCLGRPVVVSPVVDNQQVTYEHLLAAGHLVGLGPVADLRLDPDAAAAVIRELLADRDRMAGMASSGFATVDGRGRTRVADRLIRLIGRMGG